MATPLIGSDGLAGVYWQGSNGRTYTQNNLGQVVDAGNYAGGGGSVAAPGAAITINGLKYRGVADPNASAGTPLVRYSGDTSTPASSGGSALASASVAAAGPSAAQTDPLLASLASLDTILGNKNQQSQDEYSRAKASYDAQDAIDQEAIGSSTRSNEQSLTSGNQAALLNAANGATGLRGVLSSLHALGGSGVDVIKHLVGLAANKDAGAVRQTFDANAKSISTSAAQTNQQEKQRRLDADATLQNNLQNNQSTVLTSKQGIFQQLANAYGSGTSQGNNYASKASALAAPIAATTRATVAPYASAGSLFSPAALQTYLAGTQDLNANAAAPVQPINSPIYSLTNTKDKLTGVA